MMTVREAIGITIFVMLMQLSAVALVLFFQSTLGVDLVSIAVTVLVMAAVASSVAIILVVALRRYEAKHAAMVAMMTLTDDERKVLEEIMRSREIRQDDLRRKLDMSKSKLSALVNNLERKHAIIKTRHHKTNVLKPTKEFGGRRT